MQMHSTGNTMMDGIASKAMYCNMIIQGISGQRKERMCIYRLLNPLVSLRGNKHDVYRDVENP